MGLGRCLSTTTAEIMVQPIFTGMGTGDAAHSAEKTAKVTMLRTRCGFTTQIRVKNS